MSTKDIQIPDQTGRHAIVTGANSGVGYEAARRLAHAGADVVLAVRSAERGDKAARDINAESPRGSIRVELLDLSSLDSVRDFATRISGQDRAIDLLVNNAGVMAVPTRHVTADGFELQFGTNYLGHFALTNRLLPLIRAGRSPRVVHITSSAASMGRIRFDDLQAEKRYRAWSVYCQSKLAGLLFALEMQRRSERHGWGVLSNAAHPGFTRTNLQKAGPNLGRKQARASSSEMLFRLPGMAMNPPQGALPTLLAATEVNAPGGAFYGPDGLTGLTGMPKRIKLYRSARNPEIAARLWDVAEELTGTTARP